MESQLPLLSSASAHPAPHMRDVIGWLQCPSVLCHYARSCHHLHLQKQQRSMALIEKLKLLSLSFSVLFFSPFSTTLVPSCQPRPITFPIFCHFLPLCSRFSLTNHPLPFSVCIPHTFPLSHIMSCFSPPFLFPSLLFSLSVTLESSPPVPLRMGLPECCR